MELLENNSPYFQIRKALLSTGTVQDAMHQQTITFYTRCMRVKTQNFQRGSKEGKLTSWQLYQTASRACCAKSVPFSCVERINYRNAC